MTCPVEATRLALRDAWRATGQDRGALARATRLVVEITQGRGSPGHLATLRDHPLAAASLRDHAEVWRAHVEQRICAAGHCFAPAVPPCQQACPAHIDIPSFLAHVGRGAHADAVRVIQRDNPLPLSCGLICPAPCETACLRGATTGQPVFIRPLKAVAALHCLEPGYPLPERAPASGRTVAVLGSGPAGLTAAYYLAVAGHAVTVFEAQAQAGGMLRYGIPAFRLPPDLLDRELAQLQRLGVVVRAATPVARLDDLAGFDAVFLAPGTQLSRRLPLAGIDLPFVLGGLDFLRAVRRGDRPSVGPRAVVIGGGNVAVDVAMTARRQGAAVVDMVCLESAAMMPANPHEVAEARAEGVVVRDGWGPVSIEADGRVAFQRCLRVFDDDLRFAPSFDPSDTLTLQADHVLLAIGQAADLSLLDGSGVQTERGLIGAARDTLRTARSGVFAGGDAAHGPRTAVEAVRAGKQGAAAIDAYLCGRGLPADWDRPRRRDSVPPLAVAATARETLPRADMPELPVAERDGDRAIELGLSDATAHDEVNRCLRCDICIGCGLCELACSEMGPEALRLEPTPAGRLAFAHFLRPVGRCIGCGACTQVCPTGAIRMEDRDGERLIAFTGTVLHREPLVRCRRCETPYTAQAQRTRVADHGLCPPCARLAWAEQFASAPAAKRST
jgi:NADPH-dependent glutamate synthase beta subunit-like oxidoreductase/ferredoxin